MNPAKQTITHVSGNDYFSELSPAPVIEGLKNVRGEFFSVLREDKLEGGTKQRAARHFVRAQMEQGVQLFCYASPFAGFAQVALAVCCHYLGARCRIFAERDKTQTDFQGHEFTLLAKRWGATVELFEDLEAAHAASLRYAASVETFLNVPLGFDCPSYAEYFRQEIELLWGQLTQSLKFSPTRIWLPVGSGTLTRAVRKAVPANVKLECLDVGVLMPDDSRIQGLRALPNINLRHVEEKFCEGSRETPPIDSNHHYDAKLWHFLKTETRPSDLWWNVAR